MDMLGLDFSVWGIIKTLLLMMLVFILGALGFMKMLNVYDIELLKKIMIKEHVKFQNRFTTGVEPYPVYKDLIHLRDAHWKRVRGIMTPSFSASKLKIMTAEINRCSGILVQGLIEKAELKEIIEPRLHFGCYTMDVIASTAFGIELDSYSTPNDPFVYHAQKAFSASPLNPLILCTVMFHRTMRVLCKCFGVSGFFPKDSLTFFVDVTKKILKERQADGYTGRSDLLQLLINAEDPDAENQSRKKLTEDELIAQAFLIFLAGYETTATLLMYNAYALATHPEIQDKLITEIDNCIAEDETEIKYDVVMEMPYLDQVVCETLRMYPPLARMNRGTTEDQDVEIDGHWLPGNTHIGFSIYAIHHEMGLYEEPEMFIPERFSPEEKAKRDPFTFMPFGNGPRNCIGMRLALLEAKIALVAVLREVKFVKVAETEEPLELRTLEPFLRPLRPIKVGVERR